MNIAYIHFIVNDSLLNINCTIIVNGRYFPGALVGIATKFGIPFIFN